MYPVNRDRVEIVQLLTPAAYGYHQVGVLQSPQVLRDRLACHVETSAELAQGLAAPCSQGVE